MSRIKFNQGQQRMFLDFIKQKTELSLRKLAKKYKINYELVKKYKQERCFMSEFIFKKLCSLGKINCNSLDVEFLDDYWGQVKGGKS